MQLDASRGRGSDQTWMPPLRVDDGDNGLRLLDEVSVHARAFPPSTASRSRVDDRPGS